MIQFRLPNNPVLKKHFLGNNAASAKNFKILHGFCLGLSQSGSKSEFNSTGLTLKV
jgi:hypothetical protein